MLPDLVLRSLWRTSSQSTKVRPIIPIDSPNGLRDRIREKAEAIEQMRQEQSELEELNSSLVILCAVFPDVRVDVFREMLGSFSQESRLQLVTESLLKHKDNVVKGRWRERAEDSPATANSPDSQQRVPLEDRFRSSEYKNAVKLAFYQEFKSLGRSLIKTVLTEQNYSYTLARPILIELASKSSWRSSLVSFLWRRKASADGENPLLTWSRGNGDSLEPQLLPTQSDELNAELERSVILPLKQEIKEKQYLLDQNIADALNYAEAEAAESTFDCECCFTPNTFENIATCSGGQHYVCFRCIRHTLTEALYGQGWLRSVDQQKCALRCVAVCASVEGECKQCIPRHALRLAMSSEKNGQDVVRKFEERLAGENVASSRISVSKCPFCMYAEAADARDLQTASSAAWLWLSGLLFALFCALSNTSPPFSTLALLLAGALSLTALTLPSRLPSLHLYRSPPHPPPPTHPPHGRKFLCRNPTCARPSCLHCAQPWLDPHTCPSSSASPAATPTTTRHAQFRQHLDAALTAAVKRTCPRCGLSFVKATGCNKLLCPCCGTAVCYVCRAQIGPSALAAVAGGAAAEGERAGEGYSHFCPHFRPEPGERCRQCARCDLYRAEDEGAALRAARAAAVRVWRERERAAGLEPLELASVLREAGVGEEEGGEGGGGKGKGRWRWMGS